ncbi:ankyrin repeat domain-containing protein [Muricauda sp. 2012CJ35-5]|uniref:Ankyrin repeat domain-containing protein n=1 Tax=Flagellimonas spongiicola TaxID=2942208 RepID=A0ABT0PUY3_9FLAO|nr:ankyrin repeat domain-containing protein [Allomuricauda spongiicola]MCL6275169.1 ankyrin repeat domain-containing protein [Allomuricauda spongiicola]
MRKTILSAAAACMVLVAGVNANENPETIVNLKPSPVITAEINSFCKAIVQGDTDMVKKMISLGEDVNQKSLGMAPIHFAARYNRTEILEVLIANGANLRKKCDKGYTAKRYAEISNAGEALELLKSAMKK